MKRIASLLGLILCSVLAFAVKPTRITVAISPATATLYSGATKQFTATVRGTINTAVTWSTSHSYQCRGHYKEGNRSHHG